MLKKGLEPAYSILIGSIFFYLEKLDIDEAEKWLERADEVYCLDSPQSTWTMEL